MGCQPPWPFLVTDDLTPRRRRAKPPTITAPGEQREALSVWMKSRFEEMESAHQRRIEILRTAGEHPSPIFSGMIKNFGALGLSKNLVAKLMNIGVSTIEAYYKDDYDLGAAEVISSLAANAIRIGTSTTDPQAAKVAMDILARRGGPEWKPPSRQLEVDDKREQAPLIDSSKLSYEERAQLREMILRIENGGQGDPEEGSMAE